MILLVRACSAWIRCFSRDVLLCHFFIVTLKKTTLVHGSRTCGILELTSFWAHLFYVFIWALLGMGLWKDNICCLGRSIELSLELNSLSFSPFSGTEDSGTEDSEQVLYLCALFPAQLGSTILYHKCWNNIANK